MSSLQLSESSLLLVQFYTGQECIAVSSQAQQQKPKGSCPPLTVIRGEKNKSREGKKKKKKKKKSCTGYQLKYKIDKAVPFIFWNSDQSTVKTEVWFNCNQTVKQVRCCDGARKQ